MFVMSLFRRLLGAPRIAAPLRAPERQAESRAGLELEPGRVCKAQLRILMWSAAGLRRRIGRCRQIGRRRRGEKRCDEARQSRESADGSAMAHANSRTTRNELVIVPKLHNG